MQSCMMSGGNDSTAEKPETKQKLNLLPLHRQALMMNHFQQLQHVI